MPTDAKPKPLTPAQRAVLEKMADGWELGGSCGPDGRSWLQQGGVGRGVKCERVVGNTLHALYKRGLIAFGERKFPTQRYVLTDAGRQALTRPETP